MSFLDFLGNVVQRMGDFTGINDAVHDFASAFSDQGENDNLLMDIGQGLRGGLRFTAVGPQVAYSTLMGVGDVAQRGVHFATAPLAGLAAKTQYDTWHKPGETREAYENRVWDQTVWGYGEPDAVSFGQVMEGIASQQDNPITALAFRTVAGGGLPGMFPEATNTALSGTPFLGQVVGGNTDQTATGPHNPFDEADRQRYYSGFNPSNITSGLGDLGTGTALDPSWLLGPAGKVARVASRGAELVSDAERAAGLTGRVLNRGWTMNDSAFQDAVLKGRFNTTLDSMVQADTPAKAMQLPVVKNSNNPATVSFIISKTKTRDEAQDALFLLAHQGTESDMAAAQQRLLDSVLARGEDPDELSYLLNRIRSGSSEELLAARFGDDVVTDADLLRQHRKMLENEIKDQEGWVGRSFATALEEARAGEPLITRTPAKSRTIESWQVKRAQARAKGGYTVYGQASPMHPMVAVTNTGKRLQGFFTREQASGVVHFHDNDSYREVDAMIGDLNELTRGAFSESGEAEAWFNRYMAASGTGERANVFDQLERRGMDLLNAKHGLSLTKEESKEIFDRVYNRRRQLLDQYNENKFLATVDEDGNPIDLKNPVLERQSANQHIGLDFRTLDKLYKDTAKDPKLLTQWLRAGLVTADGLNDVFKASVLLRLGYGVRNVGEAWASAAMNNLFWPMVLTAADHQHLTSWVNKRLLEPSARLLDRVGVARGSKVAMETAEHDLAVARARRATAQHNWDTLQDVIANYKVSINKADAAILMNPESNPTRAAELNGLLQEIAELRAEFSRTTTFHATRNGSVPVLKGDHIDTFEATGPAEAFAQEMWRGIASTGQERVREAMGQARLGRRVQYQLPTGAWRNTNADQLERWLDDADRQSLNYRYVNYGEDPQVVTVQSLGETLDLTGGRIPDELRRFHPFDTEEGAAALRDYALSNGYGRVKFRQPGQRAATVRVFTAAVDGKGGGKGGFLAEQNLRRMMDDEIRSLAEGPAERELRGLDDATTPLRKRPLGTPTSGQYSGVTEIPLAAPSRAERKTLKAANRRGRKAARQLRGVESLAGKPEVVPGWSEQNARNLLGNGIRDTVRRLAEELAASQVQHEWAISQRAGVRARVSPKRRVVTGRTQATTTGTPFPDMFQAGHDQADIMRMRVGNNYTYEKLISDGEGVAAVASTGLSGATMTPAHPRYFEGWANMLNHYFSDGKGNVSPVVEKFIQGGTVDDVVEWATTTREGRKWAQEVGIPNSRVEPALNEFNSALHAYLPDELVQPLREGRITEELLERTYADQLGKLPNIYGKLLPQSNASRQHVGLSRKIHEITQKLFQAVGSLPETAFARHPLATAYYRQEMKRVLPRAEARKGRKLTADEVDHIARQVRERARVEVTKTLFTIDRRTGAAKKFRLISPFYAAWENSLRRWGKFVVQHPENVIKGASRVNRLMSNATLVDQQTGEVITDPLSADLDNVAVQWIGPKGYESFGIQTPVTSFDVIMQGQSLSGVGPFVVVPLSEAAKAMPNMEPLVQWAFPAGMPDDAVSQFLPPAARDLMAIFKGDQITFVNLQNKLMQDAAMALTNGERDSLPTRSEIEGKARQLYMLRALAHIGAPVSVQVNPTASYYAQELRRLRDLYGDEKGTAQFIATRPEAWSILPPLSANNTGIWATADSVDNALRYKDLISKAQAYDPKLVGWVTNYGQTYDPNAYSEAAYQWQLRNDYAPGKSFRGPQSPEEFIRNAKADYGWYQFNNYMDSALSVLQSQGVDPASDFGVQVLGDVRSKVVDALKEDEDNPGHNSPWYDEYISGEDGRFDKRAEFFETVLMDRTFMQDHGGEDFIKAMGTFLTMRAQVKDALQKIDELGGSADIGAKSNTKLRQGYYKNIAELQKENSQFSDFYNRYFVGDGVGR